MLPINIFELKVNIKTVPYSRTVWSAWYKIKISGANPQPGNQTSAAPYRAADHSFSSTSLLDLAYLRFQTSFLNGWWYFTALLLGVYKYFSGFSSLSGAK